jgi:Tfp pilus assembly major pilin PilA
MTFSLLILLPQYQYYEKESSAVNGLMRGVTENQALNQLELQTKFPLSLLQ